MGCKRCGECCRYMTMKVNITAANPSEIKNYVEYLDNHCSTGVIKGDVLYVLVPHLCRHLIYNDAKKQFECKDYPNRPKLCREYSCDKCKEKP